MPDEPHRWYLRFGKDREGPLTIEDIRYLLSQKKIDGGTFAWHKGLESWTRLRNLEEFRPARPAEEPGQAPGSETPPESGSAAKGRMPGGWLPKLAALVVALGLASGGLYWALIRPSSRPDDQVESFQVDPEARRLVEQLGHDPEAETDLLNMASSAVPALLQGLDAESLDLSPERVRRLLIGIGPAATAPLVSYLKERLGDGRVRILIVQVLGNIGGLQAVPGVVLALDDPSEAVQAQAIQTLGNLEPETAPALLSRLTGPVHKLSPQARKNLAHALKPHAGPQMEPPLRQMQTLEKDPEVRQALTEVLSRIAEVKKEIAQAPSQAKEPSPPAPLGASQTASGTPQQPAAGTGQAPPVNVQVHVSAPQAQPQEVRVHASAEARVTVPGEQQGKDPETAGEHADRGKAHLEQGERGKALAEYRQAYLLNPLPMFALIILELEPDSTATDSTSIAEEDSLPAWVTLKEIHEALSDPEQNLDAYQDALGIWKGRLDRMIPLGRESGREQFLVRSETKGHDFVAAIRTGNRREKNLQTEDLYLWKGKLQGFKVVGQGETAQVLPVLLVDEVH